MGIIYYLGKLNPGLYYLKNGRDGLINWDSDINALKFASSKFQELETHFHFEFENLTFAFFGEYKFYANTNKEAPIHFREIFSETINKIEYSKVYERIEKFLGKPTSFGINNYPSWTNNKICLKIIDFKSEFIVSVTSEPPVHDYRNETKVIRRYNKDEIIFIPNISFSFDYITSMTLKTFIDENIKPEAFDFNFDWFGEYEKGIFLKDGVSIKIDVTDGSYSFHIDNKLNESDIKKSNEWITEIINHLLLENSKEDRYNITKSITAQ